MTYEKKMYLVDGHAGGINLMVERDSGNLVQILTGKPNYSLVFWHKLSESCNIAIDALELGEKVEVTK